MQGCQVDLGGDARRVRHVGFFALAQRGDRGIEHVGVEAEANLPHLAALRLAQQFEQELIVQNLNKTMMAKKMRNSRPHGTDCGIRMTAALR